jgi:hypothetical protein
VTCPRRARRRHPQLAGDPQTSESRQRERRDMLVPGPGRNSRRYSRVKRCARAGKLARLATNLERIPGAAATVDQDRRRRQSRECRRRLPADSTAATGTARAAAVMIPIPRSTASSSSSRLDRHRRGRQVTSTSLRVNDGSPEPGRSISKLDFGLRSNRRRLRAAWPQRQPP